MRYTTCAWDGNRTNQTGNPSHARIAEHSFSLTGAVSAGSVVSYSDPIASQVPHPELCRDRFKSSRRSPQLGYVCRCSQHVLSGPTDLRRAFGQVEAQDLRSFLFQPFAGVDVSDRSDFVERLGFAGRRSDDWFSDARFCDSQCET